MVTFNLKVDKEDIINAIDSKMDEVVDYIFAESQKNIVNKNIIDEGTLLKSANVNRSLLNKEIVYPVPYSDSIEFGRLPGKMPPLEPLKGWVRRVLAINDETKVNQIAWSIANDIKENGQDARPFLRPAIESAKIKFRK